MTTDNKTTYTHESYGMIVFNRVNNGRGRSLYGSPLKNHPTTIMMRVKTSKREHSLGRDWFVGEKDLIEIELSTSQFADLITNMNIGDGVPCTISWFGGKRMESPPNVETEAEAVRIGFGDDVKEIGRKLSALADFANKSLQGSGALNKATREELMSRIKSVAQDVNANLPFVLESFQQSVEKTVTTAKTEVVSFINTLAISTGIKQLSEHAKEIQIPALEGDK